MRSSTEPGALVRKLSRLFMRSQRTRSQCADGASNVQCHVLTELLRSGSLTQQGLVERLSLDKAWISRAVDSLVSDGVITKIQHPTDKRSVQIDLTVQGRIQAEKLENSLDAHAAQLFEQIPLDKHAQIRDSLVILVEALQQGGLTKGNPTISCGATVNTSENCSRTAHIRRATKEDWPSIEAMLITERLALAGAYEHLDNFWVTTVDEHVVATGALEFYGQYALLRSLAVSQNHRSKSFGSKMVKHLHQTAQHVGLKAIYLRTTDASGFFHTLGFSEIAHDKIPSAILQSSQFRGACPTSATNMQIAFKPNVS